MLFRNTVSPELWDVLQKVMLIPEIQQYRLVGETAMALQIGHRESVDIDLFCNEKQEKRVIEKSLNRVFSQSFFRTTYKVQSTINNVKIELFDDWETPFQHPPVIEEGIRLASMLDIGSLKLDALIGRREKKDYIDLYFLFEKFGAAQIIDGFRQSNPLVSIKSIVFALGEVHEAINNKSVMPKMYEPVSWDAIAAKMIEVAKTYTKRTA